MPNPLPPGPELDAKIADMLGYFAWKEKRGNYALCFVLRPDDRHADAPWKASRDGTPERYERVTCEQAKKIGFFVSPSPIPKFSQNMGAAWEVVAEVQRRNVGWRFMLIGGDAKFGGFRAEFFGHIDPAQDYGQRHGEAHAATAPHAICLAAIAALSVQEKGAAL